MHPGCVQCESYLFMLSPFGGGPDLPTLGGRPVPRFVVEFRELVPYPTGPGASPLVYPRPVLYPPSSWSIGYPIKLRRSGHTSAPIPYGGAA